MPFLSFISLQFYCSFFQNSSILKIVIEKSMFKWKIQGAFISATATVNSVTGFSVQQKATLLTLESCENIEMKKSNEILFPEHHGL